MFFVGNSRKRPRTSGEHLETRRVLPNADLSPRSHPRTNPSPDKTQKSDHYVALGRRQLSSFILSEATFREPASHLVGEESIRIRVFSRGTDQEGERFPCRSACSRQGLVQELLAEAAIVHAEVRRIGGGTELFRKPRDPLSPAGTEKIGPSHFEASLRTCPACSGEKVIIIIIFC